MRGTAIVEFHVDGNLVKGSVQGFHGIDHLTDVIVTGKLQVDKEGNLLVLADKIHAE